MEDNSYQATWISTYICHIQRIWISSVSAQRNLQIGDEASGRGPEKRQHTIAALSKQKKEVINSSCQLIKGSRLSVSTQIDCSRSFFTIGA